MGKKGEIMIKRLVIEVCGWYTKGNGFYLNMP